MPATVASVPAPMSRGERLETLLAELSQLCGQRNAIDGRIVEITADIDGQRLWSATPTPRESPNARSAQPSYLGGVLLACAVIHTRVGFSTSGDTP